MKSTIIFPILLVAGALVLLVYVSVRQPRPLQFPTEIQVVDTEGEVVMVVSSGGDVPAESKDAATEETPRTPRSKEMIILDKQPTDIPPGNTEPANELPAVPDATTPETAYNAAAVALPEAETAY